MSVNPASGTIRSACAAIVTVTLTHVTHAPDTARLVATTHLETTARFASAASTETHCSRTTRCPVDHALALAYRVRESVTQTLVTLTRELVPQCATAFLDTRASAVIAARRTTSAIRPHPEALVKFASATATRTCPHQATVTHARASVSSVFTTRRAGLATAARLVCST